MKIGYYALAFAVVMLGVLLLLVQTSLIPSADVKIVQSGSMEPAISTGSLVLVQVQERYQTDEVITFTTRGTSNVPTTHRIVRDALQAGELVYYTKGDANADVDPEPVRLENVIGKVVFSVPYLGYLLDFARQPLGFALLIGVPAALIVFEEVSSIWGEVRKKPVEKSEETEIHD